MQSPPADLALPPIATYAKACSRCHGPGGGMLPKPFAHHETEALWNINKEMMTGPAFLKPSHADVDAMTAYMRAIEQDVPLIVVTRRETLGGDRLRLSGEVSPGAELTCDNVEAQPTITESGAWSWQGKVGKGLCFRAQLGDAQATLKYPRQGWHAPGLEPANTHEHTGEPHTDD